MQPLVSVIVPVYKVEEDLARCLDSLRKQSLSNIEILLVDDASPDECGKICDAYASQDDRFRVFHNEVNQGLSVARNIGIANAYADYLMFVDSDDWVHKDFCKSAYECAICYNADLVMFRCQFIKKTELSERAYNYSHNYTKNGYKTRLEAIDLLQKDISVGHFAWNKLYRKELFNHISYPQGYLCEDGGTTYKTVWHAKRIYYLDQALYYYCYREDSITNKKTEKYIRDLYEMSMQRYRDLSAWGYPADKLDMVLKNVALVFCIMKKPNNSDPCYVYCENVLRSSKNIPDLTLRRRFLFALFKYCRPLFEFICIMCKKKVC